MHNNLTCGFYKQWYYVALPELCMQDSGKLLQVGKKAIGKLLVRHFF